MNEAGYCSRCGQPMSSQMKFGRLRAVCTACGFIRFDDPKVAVAALIAQSDQILLVKRAIDPERGKWALPAGYVDRGEDPQLALIREVREETGLEVVILRLVDVMFDGSVILIVYAAHIIGGTLCADDDAEACQWFSPQNLPELGFRSTQIIVEQWLAHIQGDSL